VADIALVAAGGAAGAVLRYAIGGVIASRAGTAFPWHTLVVNVLGAFLLGLLMALSAERALLGPSWRTLLGIGVLGGFTTFSTLAYESVRLMEQGLPTAGLLNVFGSALLGLIAVIAGLGLGRAL
jgi:camphor resistance protein CrcB